MVGERAGELWEVLAIGHGELEDHERWRRLAMLTNLTAGQQSAGGAEKEGRLPSWARDVPERQEWARDASAADRARI